MTSTARNGGSLRLRRTSENRRGCDPDSMPEARRLSVHIAVNPSAFLHAQSDHRRVRSDAGVMFNERSDLARFLVVEAGTMGIAADHLELSPSTLTRVIEARSAASTLGCSNAPHRGFGLPPSAPSYRPRGTSCARSRSPTERSTPPALGAPRSSG